MCGWQRREKVQPCKTQGGNDCVGDRVKQREGMIEVNEEWGMLGRGPGSCPTYAVPLSLLFGEVKLASKFPPRINCQEESCI